MDGYQMKEYFYMKDLMDYLKITRDAIKYYEQKGLITSCRDRNGYRKFNQVTFQKLERICTMRTLGFSLDEIKLSLSKGRMSENGEAAFDARLNEIEEQRQLLETRKKLLLRNREFSKSFDEYYQNCHLYDSFFVCIASSNREKCRQATLWRRELSVYVMDESGEIKAEEEFSRVILDDAVVDNLVCDKCCHGRNGLIQSRAIRLVIKQSESDNLANYIRDMYRWSACHGYQTGNKVYAQYAFYYEQEDGEQKEEGIAVDLYLPVNDAHYDSNRNSIGEVFNDSTMDSNKEEKA